MEEQEYVYLIGVTRVFSTCDADDIFETSWEEDSVLEPAYKSFKAAAESLKERFERHLEDGDAASPTTNDDGDIYIVNVFHKGGGSYSGGTFECYIRYGIMRYELHD